MITNACKCLQDSKKIIKIKRVTKTIVWNRTPWTTQHGNVLMPFGIDQIWLKSKCYTPSPSQWVRNILHVRFWPHKRAKKIRIKTKTTKSSRTLQTNSNKNNNIRKRNKSLTALKSNWAGHKPRWSSSRPHWRKPKSLPTDFAFTLFSCIDQRTPLPLTQTLQRKTH